MPQMTSLIKHTPVWFCDPDFRKDWFYEFKILLKKLNQTSDTIKTQTQITDTHQTQSRKLTSKFENILNSWTHEN